MKAEFPDIGLATVYRTIQLLLDLDLVESVQLGDGYVRYEIGKLDNHEVKLYGYCETCLRQKQECQIIEE